MRLRMCGTIPPLPLHTFTECLVTILMFKNALNISDYETWDD
jgi:hypothetical protein